MADEFGSFPGALTVERADCSPFLAQAMHRHEDVVAAVCSEGLRAGLAVAENVDAQDTGVFLRRIRNRTLLAVALCDLAGTVQLETVVAAISDFADFALDRAIAAAVAAHVPGAANVGFAAIALGKHGSRELNYSSDIDPIFVYDPDTLPRRPREEPGEAAVRIARRVVDLLQSRDAEGFVFRVDLRLRPASEATPIALPIEAAIAHYESSALPWERAAFIRARAAAGDVALGIRFLDAVQPFVWRRTLDFGAVEELRSLTRRIRAAGGARAFGPGYDVKRGRGGIREAEFFAQIHQLIHGGRDPRLRIGATMPALAALADASWISRTDADDLIAAYRLLRTIEHRLQLVDDRQTHELPRDAAQFDRVAQLHGCRAGADLLAMLQPHMERVATIYDALDRDQGTGRSASSGTDLAKLGFLDARAAGERVARWRQGGVRAIRSPAAVAAFEDLLPSLLAALGRAPDPDAALARLDRLLGTLSSGINLFRLLDTRPELRRMLVGVLSHAPTLADALALRPALIDRLIDRTALGPVPDIDALTAEMIGDAQSTESMFDRVRLIVGEYRFALGIQIVERAADPIDVAAGYSRVAEAAVEAIIGRVVCDFEHVHGRVPASEFLVLALGRLGGGQLTHASDLDLIYLFTGDYLSESDGRKPLGASLYFNRLAQRATAALSVPTAAGALYQVDTRLRPSGAQGPLVVSLDSFDRYQREAAWTWEHMALLRARPVFGSGHARAAAQAVIGAALQQSRDPKTLLRDVAAMRRDVALHKPPAGPFDVKLQAGGLVDLEFAVHARQLAHRRALVPDLRQAIGLLAEAGLVEGELLGAHDLLTRLLVTLRLVSPSLDEPAAASRALIAGACGVQDWSALLVEYASARHCVTRHWVQTVRQAEEEA